MHLGVDMSMMDEFQREFQPVFKYNDEEIDPYTFFVDHNQIETLRLRLWNDPYDKDGNPYGGGTNDLAADIRMALKAKEAGMNTFLAFHYSDFYASPGEQKLPKAWENLSYPEIVNEMYNYTKNSLLEFKHNAIDIIGVQLGNETTNGMLFPFGEVTREYTPEKGGGFKGFSELLKAACRAVREVYPNTKIVISIEHIYELANTEKDSDGYFSNLIANNVDFDIIGTSYYPYWHGGLISLGTALDLLKNKFNKPIWLVEVGYEYAESFIKNHHYEFASHINEPEFQIGNLNGRKPFILTKKGQKNYFKKIIEISLQHNVDYLFYWEPCWIYQPGNGWAKPAGLEYKGWPKDTVTENDWANETLFDFQGNANPALDIYSMEYINNL